VKDPTKENALDREIGVVHGEPGHISAQIDAQIPEMKNLLSSYTSTDYDFKYWNPDPDEFTKNAEHKEDGKTSYVPNVTHATFEKRREPRHNILFIVPHPMLGSFNRKDEYSVANDGTVTSKMSKQDFKPEDFQR